MNIEKRCAIVTAVLDGSRVWEEATNKSGIIEELNPVVAGLKEEIISLKGRLSR